MTSTDYAYPLWTDFPDIFGPLSGVEGEQPQVSLPVTIPIGGDETAASR